MVLNSLAFAAFFLIFLAVLLVLPKKLRKAWLLLGNLAFAFTWERWGPVLLILSALMVWGCGLALEKSGQKRESQCLLMHSSWKTLLIRLLFSATGRHITFFCKESIKMEKSVAFCFFFCNFAPDF